MAAKRFQVQPFRAMAVLISSVAFVKLNSTDQNTSNDMSDRVVPLFSWLAYR